MTDVSSRLASGGLRDLYERWMSRIMMRDTPWARMKPAIQRAYKPLKPPEARRELMSVMDSLVAVGWLEPEAPTGRQRGVAAWRINPRVHPKFAARAKAEAERRREARERLAEVLAKVRG